MLGKNGIFRGKSFEKSFFPRNSAEFSTESDFPRKKMYEKSRFGHLTSLDDNLKYFRLTLKHCM
jgi:hypothetical protein